MAQLPEMTRRAALMLKAEDELATTIGALLAARGYAQQLAEFSFEDDETTAAELSAAGITVFRLSVTLTAAQQAKAALEGLRR